MSKTAVNTTETTLRATEDELRNTINTVYDASVYLEKAEKALNILTEDYFSSEYAPYVTQLYQYVNDRNSLSDDDRTNAELSHKYLYEKDRVEWFAQVAFGYIHDTLDELNKILKGGVVNE